MHEARPSRTALRVALRRAAHQMHDARPLIFEDPFAVRILGPTHAEELSRTPDSERRPYSAALRAWMVTRARYAEDVLAQAVQEGGAEQYLILGAGLDTFAYRNPHAGVRVFEVDHPATQAWKREQLLAANILPPATMQFVAVDFEKQSLAEELAVAGFDPLKPTVTAWLGVVPYLTPAAFRATTQYLGHLTAGSRVVFDYSQPREVLSHVEQLMHDSLSERVALAGEPFQLFFTPESLRAEVVTFGLLVAEDLGSQELTARYMTSRTDGLSLRGKAARLCQAVVGA